MLLKDGSRIGDGVFLFRVLAKDHHSVRIASPVSIKVSKKAVERNKLRRRVQEVLRKQMETITPGVDVLVQMRPGALELTYEEIKERLEKLLIKAKLIQETNSQEKRVK